MWRLIGITGILCGPWKILKEQKRIVMPHQISLSLPITSWEFSCCSSNTPSPSASKLFTCWSLCLDALALGTLLAHSLTPLLTSVHICEQKRTCPITLIIHLCFSPECIQLTLHIIHVSLCLLSVFPNKNQGRCRQRLSGRHLFTSLLQVKTQGTRARSGDYVPMQADSPQLPKPCWLQWQRWNKI